MSEITIPEIKLKPEDAYYIAGLFDGEGCICIGWGSKKYFSIKGQQYVLSNFPVFQLVISNNNNLLLEIVKNLLGVGNFYKSKNGNGYCYRIAKREDILAVIEALLPYVKLKHPQLHTAKRAIHYHLERGHSPWTSEQKKHFYDNYMEPLEKYDRIRNPGGRPTTTTLDQRLSNTPKFLKNKIKKTE